MKPQVIVFGGSGLVGSRFCELSSFGIKAQTPSHADVDLRDKDSVHSYLKNTHADFIINFAAYTNVSEAEKQRDDKNGDCWKLNVGAVENILEAKNPNSHLIQISTDMVFSGSASDPGPYDESHHPEADSNKVVWYGYSKGIAEGQIKQFGGDYTILRVIYPVRAKFAKKLDYLRKPLKLFDEGKLYPMFNDQQISNSFIDEVSETLDKIIAQKATGIFHVSYPRTTTPYDLVSYLLEKARGARGAVQPSSLSEFLKSTDNSVRYPQFGGLLAKTTQQVLGLKYDNWQAMVDELVLQGLESD